MSALPIGGEGGDTPRRGVPAGNEAVPGGGAWCVRETTEPESKKKRERSRVRVGCGVRIQCAQSGVRGSEFESEVHVLERRT